ncbi:MAG TPA: arsenate reductase ArsC [Gemmatimonadales bacterium]|jgi:arsenate reductase|nr:arsenate reductase ArsC [Gemmatimonadales bacterium]
MPTILFLCVKNSARSQIAEGLARALAPAGYDFLSAGSRPGSINPLAITVLAEQDIDIAQQRAKGLEAVALSNVDMVVTLCAEEVCPAVPGSVRRLHWGLPDPHTLEDFRSVRDELRRRLPALWSQ